MNENIECKGGVTFLKINVFGESSHLNPFKINTRQIRYIRKYDDPKGDAWAIIIGDKMYPTRDLNFDEVKIGEVIEIGDTKFECATTSSLTEKGGSSYKTLINYNNILFIRKYISKKDNKIDSESVLNSENLAKFALNTIDGRIIPIFNEQNANVRSNDGAGSPGPGAPVPNENM